MSINSKDPQFRIDAHLPKQTRIPYKISVGIGLWLTVLAGVFYFKLQPEIPLFYSLSQPAQQLAAKQWIFLLPILSILVTFTNFSLVKKNADLESVLITVISWVTVTWQIILSLIFIRIILITW